MCDLLIPLTLHLFSQSGKGMENEKCGHIGIYLIAVATQIWGGGGEGGEGGRGRGGGRGGGGGEGRDTIIFFQQFPEFPL